MTNLKMITIVLGVVVISCLTLFVYFEESGKATNNTLAINEPITIESAVDAYERENYSLSLKLSANLADRSDIEANAKSKAKAKNLLALHYYYGQGTEEDREQARSLFQEAFDNGYSGAARNLAILLEEDKNYPAARDMYQTATDLGVSEAAYEIGRLHEAGLLGDPDTGKAIEFYTIAAEDGVLRAQVALMKTFLKESGGYFNPESAYQWALEAYQSGDQHAAYILGFGKHRGYHTAKDINRAIKYYEYAGEGFPAAYYELGYLYSLGKDVPVDYKKAIAYLLKAKEKGHPDAYALLGVHHELGNHFKKDWSVALALYSKACSLGSEPGCSSKRDLEQRIARARAMERLSKQESHSTTSGSSSQRNTNISKRSQIPSSARTCSRTGIGPGNYVTCGAYATTCERTGIGPGNHVACGGLATTCERTGIGEGNRAACGGLATRCERTGIGPGNDVACGGLATTCERTGIGPGNSVACGGKAKTCERTGIGKGNNVACGGLATRCESTGYDGYEACGGLARQ